MSLHDVRSRTAARKETGENQVYPRHAPGAAAQAPRPAARRPLPCVALGPVVERKSCNCRRNDVRTCLKGRGNVTQAVDCESCPPEMYEPETDDADGAE